MKEKFIYDRMPKPVLKWDSPELKTTLFINISNDLLNTRLAYCFVRCPALARRRRGTGRFNQLQYPFDYLIFRLLSVRTAATFNLGWTETVEDLIEPIRPTLLQKMPECIPESV